ncbi:MAG: AAA family ATPase [Spirochaeta sp. LUC14_002_19_P3]|nr:MAG: AAA family ATPase [Spirochaeta sp. LUC14_002_19_P3]
MSEKLTAKLEQTISRLNPQQRQAVSTTEGPLLIVAGAGSGKTGVITARIALMLAKGIPPQSILALTFTNKAAREMAARVKELCGCKKPGLNISTFHAFGVRIIGEQTQRVHLRPKFTIYDSADKLSALREAVRELGLSYEPAQLNSLAALFSDIKTRRKEWNPATAVHKPLYEEYQTLTRLHNAVDFDDLIVKPLVLLENDSEIRARYRRRYQYIMVDEFQDTSTIQYLLVRHLAEEHRNLCCVGDDDQSIYSWRGADFTNILNFEKDFPEREEIKLEQNYRSTGIILKAANAVIANNSGRKSKNLWTEDRQDEVTIQYTLPKDDTEEAEFIADTIIEACSSGQSAYGKIGILVRTNTLTRSIEETLLSCNIPYTVSGGTSFFSRQEIKDIIAYLRVIDNPDDDVNFLRIINTPRRGIGKNTLEVLVQKAREYKYSLYSTASTIIFDNKTLMNDRMRAGLAEFIDLIETYREEFSPSEPRQASERSKLADTVTKLIEEIEYWSHLLAEFRHNEKIAKWRYENIQTFVDLLSRWENSPDNLEPTLTRWLNRITLNTMDQLEDDGGGKVNLMTIHAAKGLEFDIVFLPGVEEGIIPHQRSLEESPLALEEERRLFYVAITRARRRLYISTCQTRRIRHETLACVPSSFLDEIPRELMETTVKQEKNLNEEDISGYFANLPWK